MKIALLVQELGSGGAERVMLTLAAEFVRLGHPCTILVVTERGRRRRTEVPSGVEVRVLGATRALTSAPALRRYLLAAQPDVVLTSAPHLTVIGLVARAAARSSTKVIATEHCVPSYVRAHGSSVQLRLAYRMLGAIYRRCDGVVAVSRGVAEDLVSNFSIPQEHVAVIENPIPLVQDAGLAPHPWMEGPAPVILAAGRLTSVKDFSTLLKAFVVVRSQRQARLVILGEGPLAVDLGMQAKRLGISDDVLFAGFVQNATAWFANADVVAVSSLAESFCNVIVEALACGTPVVSTDCPFGPREILEGGEIGRLVPVGDHAALANAIIATLDSETNAEALIRRAGDFAPMRTARRYLHVLGGRDSRSSDGTRPNR